jgi:RNA polymerase sigma-70 factor (ECF subfamily)
LTFRPIAAGARPRGAAHTAWDPRELSRRCHDGSVAAYAEFARQYSRRLVNLAVRLTGSRETAETAVRETFLAAFRSMERTPPPADTWPWLAALVVRTIGGRGAPGGSVALAPHRPPGVPTGRGHVGRPGPLPDAAGLVVPPTDGNGEVDGALRDLPYAERAALALHWVAGLDCDAAAVAMGVSRAAYRGLLQDGLVRLRGSVGAVPGGHVAGIDPRRSG